MSRRDVDVVVVGSGFGGSVSALRLTEKGYRVLVLEAGRRFTDEDFPRTSWDLRNYLWAPWAGCYGVLRLTLLRDVLVVAGAGVGGGSLVYANTLYEPPDGFYADPQWADMTDWRRELAPYYDQAGRMLGVTDNPVETPADLALAEVAEEMGRAHTYRPTPVGVLFGERPGTPVADPFFGGVGPARTTCVLCGSCMTGCRVGAKNTLPKNYLGLAEAAGAQVRPLTTAVALRPLTGGGWAVDTRATRGRGRETVTAHHVVLAAGTLGSQRLLQQMKVDGVLPRLSARLGTLTRTNSEAVLGVAGSDDGVDHSRGVAISSSIHPDDDTHVEVVRFGKGSNALGLLATILVDGDRPGQPRQARWRRFLAAVAADPAAFARSLSVRRWSERGVVILVMQSVDNSLDVVAGRAFGGRGRLRLTTSRGPGAANPTWIPAGNDVTRRLARRLDAEPMGSWTEVVDTPVTAHILGGCPIGASAATGVLDGWQRVFGYPGLHVVDGSAVPANLGVNPSLTITAMAERAMAYWPNLGEPDPRPALGAAYVPRAAVPPHRPYVPAGAPAALRLPVDSPA